MTARPKLLFLCQTLPYPPDGGVWIRTYHVLRLLSRAFDITALCFERAGSGEDGGNRTVAASRQALGRFANVEVFTIPQKHNRLRFAGTTSEARVTARLYPYLYESALFDAG